MKAIATVRVELEIVLDQPWSHDFTIAQVHEQAKNTAEHRFGCLLQKHPDIRMVGKMTARCVMVEDADT